MVGTSGGHRDVSGRRGTAESGGCWALPVTGMAWAPTGARTEASPDPAEGRALPSCYRVCHGENNGAGG